MIDTTKLRELAQKATPGPWYVSAPAEQTVWYDIKDRRYPIADTSGGFTDDGNAEHIAAANPAVVLALLDDLQAMREDLTDARNGWEQAAQELNEAATCIANQAATIGKLQQIEAAARNLAKAKGRHNSEIAMNQLLAALKS